MSARRFATRPFAALTAATRSHVGVTAGLLLFALFSLNFGNYKVFGDGTHYFAFVQRLFGDRPDAGGYNFGVGLLNAPFYAIGRLGRALGVAGGLSHALPAAAITLASIAYVLCAALLCAWLIERLGLPRPGLVVTAAVFGTPVWYYASFSPSHSHAADAAVFTVATVLLLGLWRRPTTQRAVAVGMVLGLAVAVRPFNVGVVAGLCVTLLAYRRVRDAVVTGVAAVVSFGLLAAIPLSLGLSPMRTASGDPAQDLGFYPLSPLQMLFTDHRGLFVWTPVTLLATIGMVLLLRRRPRDGYLAALTGMAAGLLIMHSAFGARDAWDAGWSFSARFLASLLPFYAIGLAGLLAAAAERARVVVAALVVVAAAWSVFIGMNHAFGADQPDGASDIVAAYFDGRRTPRDFVRLTWTYSRIRHVVERGSRLPTGGT